MSEFEVIRAAIAIGMMSVATYYDVRTRYVDDRVWVISLGIFAAVSLVFIFGFGVGIQELISPLNTIGMMSGFGITFTGWIMKFGGIGYSTGDLFGLLTLFTILPSFYEIPIPIIIITSSCLFSVVITIGINLRINIKSKNLFSEFDEPAYKKMLAYCMMHKKTENEKFTFPAEITVAGKRKFQFRHDPDVQKFTTETKRGYVCSTVPMMLSILVGLCFAIITSITL